MRGHSSAPTDQTGEEPGSEGEPHQAKLGNSENRNGSSKNLANKDAANGMTAEEKLQNIRMSKILEVCLSLSE